MSEDEWERTSAERIRQTINYLPTLINVTRIVVALAVLVFHLLLRGSTVIAADLPHFNSMQLYLWEFVYGFFIVVMAFAPQWQISDSKIPLPINLFDITMMVLLTHLAGGLDTGFGILILPFIATSCISSGGRNALAYAAFATLLIFSCAAWTLYLGSIDHGNTAYSGTQLFLQAGLLATACFFVAILSAFGSKNIRHAITAIQENETQIASLNRLNKLVLDNAQEGIVVTDGEGAVQLFNQQAQHYLPRLQAAESLAELTPLIGRWQNHLHRPFDDSGVFGGQEILMRATPLTEHEPPLLLISLRSANEVAEESHANKLASLGQLTANLAHEIRNPLSAISHANELLQENNIDDVDEHLKHIIEHNVARINKMIQEILSLNKRDRIDRKTIRLKQYLKEFLTEFMLSNPHSVGCLKIRMSCEDCIIFVDEGHLHQILSNLMNNAWKYSKQDQDAIRITVQNNPDNDQEIVISITDNGNGVAPDVEARIFEPFFTTSSDGTGLGLYVARELAQANNGQLMYRSKTHAFELILKVERQ
ncbi:MAG: HAMP domain-containing sensor histidine kinase [Neisseria sp.]|nr:HAMP domain-containing sensor histidine kinase [Neisseria sp.]